MQYHLFVKEEALTNASHDTYISMLCRIMLFYVLQTDEDEYYGLREDVQIDLTQPRDIMNFMVLGVYLRLVHCITRDYYHAVRAKSSKKPPKVPRARHIPANWSVANVTQIVTSRNFFTRKLKKLTDRGWKVRVNGSEARSLEDIALVGNLMPLRYSHMLILLTRKWLYIMLPAS